METLIFGLVIAIVFCIILLIIFSIHDAVKRKKVKKSKNNTNSIETIKETPKQVAKEIDSLIASAEIQNRDDDDDDSSLELDNLLNNLKQMNGLIEEPRVINGDDNSVEVIKDSKPQEAKEENTAQSEKNIESIDENETEAVVGTSEEVVTTDTEVTPTSPTESKSTSVESYKEILEKIVREYQQSLIKNDVVSIKYLSDNCLELNYDKGTFYLRNEEIIINGFLQAEDEIYNVKAGDTVIIRFCVNFSIPDGYDIKIEADKLALNAKNLELLHISNAPDSNTSIRATVVAKKDGTINRWEKLFTVKVMKEVVV